MKFDKSDNPFTFDCYINALIKLKLFEMRIMKYKIPVIGGATACSKSDLAVLIGEQVPSEIISADSRQIYKYLKIGTNVPSENDLSIIPHHLVSERELDSQYTAGDFIKDSKQLIQNILNKEKLPIIAGGTGFYLKSLLHGLNKIPDINSKIKNEALNQIENNDEHKIYEFCSSKDPEYFSKVSYSDKQRLERWLEVFLGTGRTLTDWYSSTNKTEFDYPYGIYVLYYSNRKELYDRINLRVDIMVSKGLIDEVEKYIEYRNNPAFNTIGYKEILEYFDGNCSKEEAIDKIKKNTRNFAKRQITYFKQFKEAEWFDLSKTSLDSIVEKILADIKL